MKDLGGIRVRTGEIYEEEMEFEIKAVDNRIVKDLEKFSINGFRIIGNVVSVGFESLSKFKVNGELFSLVDSEKDVMIVCRFVDDVVVITGIMKLENIVDFKKEGLK